MSTVDIKSGFWIDYNRSGINREPILTLALLHDPNFRRVSGPPGGPIFRLLIGPISWLWRKISSWRWYGQPDSGRRGLGPDVEENGVRICEIENAHNRGEMLSYALRNIWLVGGRFGNALSHSQQSPHRIRRRDVSEALGVGTIIIIILGLPVSFIIASVFSGGLVTDSIALSNSNNCGMYTPTFDSDSASMHGLEFEHMAESRAANYASICYGPSSTANYCKRFANQSISYSVQSPTECPFSGDVCYNEQKGGIRFTTGLVPGSIVGINARNPFLFSRTMTCSPLIDDENYISIGRSPTGFSQWEYWYGRSLGNYTWANPVYESAWEIKGYSTGIHCSETSSPNSPFAPLPEFTAGVYPVTLMFISSHSIMHQQHRLDPIFPSRTKVMFPSGYNGPQQYINNSTRAAVLGCVDQYQICKSPVGPCWTNENDTFIPRAPKRRAATEEENVAALLLLSLDLSTACGSIQFRGAAALDAQSKIAHMQSLKLAPNQWQVEAEKLFQTSLARIQLNAYDISRGTAASFDGYHDIMPAEYRGICGLVEIETRGWKNINFLGLLGTVVGVAIIWGISLEIKDVNGVETLMAVLVWRNYIKTTLAWMWTELQISVLQLSYSMLLVTSIAWQKITSLI